MAKTKFLVTGGLGLIGHNVVKMLQAKKHEVHVIDAFTSYGSIDKTELENLYNLRLKKINKNTQIYQEDICIQEIEQIFSSYKPDVVIHLASFPREAAVKENPVEAARTMCVGTANILNCCTKAKTKKFVYISSSMVYGNFDHANELDKVNPSGQYSIWKIAGEELVHEYARTTKQDTVIIRPTAVYGELDVSNRVIGTFFKRAFEDETLYVNGKNETLDFTHVDDTAQGIVQASLANVTGVYNISRQKLIKIKDVADKIVKLVGKGKVKVRGKQTDMPSRGTLDCDKAKKAFKFAPKIDIDKGLKTYYGWLKDSIYRS